MQGQEVDAPLNEKGVEQVERTASLLSGTHADLIISSPLKRALETAEIINKVLRKQIITDDRLKEVSYGSLANKTWAEIERETGDGTLQKKEKDVVFDYRPFGGESVEDVKMRVGSFLEEVKTKYPTGTLLIATHGVVVDVIHVLLPQKEKKEVDNATIHEFEL